MRARWLADIDDLLATELATGSPASPFRPAVLRWAAANGRPADPEPLLASLEASRIGGRGGERRYRWSLPVSGWIPADERAAWRRLEPDRNERILGDRAARLWVPPVLVEHVEWLVRTCRDPDVALAARARRLLEEATPTLEDDVARYVLGQDAWGDTFALWTFARRTRALTHVRGLVSAIGSRYAARATRTGGLVTGRSYPYFDQPMPSATAHLASAAARTGEGIALIAPAVEWLTAQRNPDGGWGDPRQGSDILTTLAVAELMGYLDPRFDPAAVLDVLGSLVDATGGRPVLIGPEWPWVAGELLAFAAWSERPFRERFRWPHMPDSVVDQRVRVPRYEAYLVDARLFERVPGLSAAPIEIAFLDMAGFGAWNTDHGQAAGDELLALLTSQLRTLPESRTIRDGGDEFLIVGAPESTGLEDRMRALFARWPAVSLKQYPDLPVVPVRAAITGTRADDLPEARVRLGVWIGEVKHAVPKPTPEGVIVRYPR